MFPTQTDNGHNAPLRFVPLVNQNLNITDTRWTSFFNASMQDSNRRNKHDQRKNAKLFGSRLLLLLLPRLATLKNGGSSKNIQWSTSFVNSIMTRMAIIRDDSRSRKSHSGTITHITSWHLKVNSSGWMWYLDRVTESPHIFLSRSGVSHSIYSIYFSSVRDIRARIIDLVAPLVYIYSISDFQTRAAATQLAWFLLRLWGHE